ncbi:amino acid ABC transporter substrate-binding protein (PAAT family) [Streptomyces sp. TLI_235]|nr:ABC transporter substrate-binding protein [Streptomyces sp. TLI_235]PBC69562.1 amino acid ABC transporter substrate-binding protein (PAAT family) [Streptomyces sp. TLI_235]
MIRTRTGRVVAVVGLTISLAAACGAPAKSADGSSELFRKLPRSYQSAREILVGSDIRTPPLEYRGPDGSVTGMEADLAAAMGERLGVRFRFVDTPFDGLIRGLQAKKYDLVLSGMTDTPARRDGRDAASHQVNEGVDFVDYFMAGTAVVAAKGNPKKITSFDGLCGKSIALRSGTIHEEFTRKQSQYCSAPQVSKGGIVIQQVQSEAEAFAAVAGGQADATMTDYPVAVYQVQTVGNGNRLEVAMSQIRPKPYGMAVRKEDGALAESLVQAMEKMMSDGTYQEILKKWNLEQGAVYSAMINSG